MKSHLLLPILLIIIILTLLLCSSPKIKYFLPKTHTQENFFNLPSPSPTDKDKDKDDTRQPSPSPSDKDKNETTQPSPSPTDKAATTKPIQLTTNKDNISKGDSSSQKCKTGYTLSYPMNEEGKIDYSDLGLFHCDLTEEITKVIHSHIGNVKLNFSYEEGILKVFTDSFDYKNVDPQTKTDIEEKIKIKVIAFMNKKYLKFKKPEFNINKHYVEVITANIPHFMHIKISPPSIQKTLTPNDIEILEFLNFKNVLDGKQAITEKQFRESSYMSPQSPYAPISNSDINNLHTKLNYLHLQMLAQSRKNNTRNQASSSDGTSKAPTPSGSPLDNLGYVSNNPSPSPTPSGSPLDNLGSVSNNPSPSPTPSGSLLDNLGSVSNNPSPSPAPE